MIDPLLSLSFSLQSNKGTYALLIGSGVSRAAQIPTGWEVLQDLINQIALLEGADTKGEPAKWYEDKYGEAPDYSRVLEAVVKSQAERSQLLRKYFEPTDEQKERGEKEPTEAHTAIARLVAAGYIKVIITTNFDRLLETAIEKEGIAPIVISNPNDIKGAPPLAHSACTIIKAHGDYLDARILNTTGELSTYSPATNKLLDQIFDEYGLIIAGWSGDWDIALRAALERCKSHRYTTYWSSRSTLSDTAQKLATLRKAEIINISSAESFFTALEQKLTALDEYARPHPLSVETSIVALKRNMAEARYRIQLHDQIVDETETTYQRITSDEFTTQVGIQITGDYAYDRLQKYEAYEELLLALLVNLAYYAASAQTQYITKSLDRIASQKQIAGSTLLLKLQLYPALLLEYASGIAAIAGNNAHSLKAVFGAHHKKPGEKPEVLYGDAHTLYISTPDSSIITKQDQNRYTPNSDYLYGVLRDKLRRIVPDDLEYEHAFDEFEMLIAMMFYKVQSKTKFGFQHAPVGSFGWRGSHFGDTPLKRLATELDNLRGDWLPIRAGLFADYEEAKAALDAITDYVSKMGFI